jgi:hypothetical protein
MSRFADFVCMLKDRLRGVDIGHELPAGASWRLRQIKIKVTSAAESVILRRPINFAFRLHIFPFPSLFTGPVHFTNHSHDPSTFQYCEPKACLREETLEEEAAGLLEVDAEGKIVVVVVGVLSPINRQKNQRRRISWI